MQPASQGANVEINKDLLTFHQKVKLGKKAAKFNPKALHLETFFMESLPPAPAEVDHTGGLTEFGMMLNDQLGCCTIAGLGHAEQTWSADRGGEYTLPDEAILQKYKQWCGYTGDPSTDQGGVEVDVLDAFMKHGFWKHPLTAYADTDAWKVDSCKKAIEIFGGIYIGVQLPASAQGRRVWNLHHGADSIPGSWGGHAVWVPKYRTLADGSITFTAISWGELYDITQDFWLYATRAEGPYIDEVHALIAPEYLSLKTGKSPEGFDLATLLAAKNKL
jgi:hypothetical protein